MIVYGRNPVREAILGPRTVESVWASPGALREPWLAKLEKKVIHAADDDWLVGRAGSGDHQGICAQVSEFRYADADALLEIPDALIVVLDQVQDPQNLGAICRTAECAGAAGVVIPERRAAEVTPAVCKASAGAVEWLPVARTRNLHDYLALAKQRGAWCYGAAAGATDYRKVDLRSGKTVLVLGSEGQGLRPRVAGACDQIVSLPMSGRIDSLSVSSAAAVLLYAAARPGR